MSNKVNYRPAGFHTVTPYLIIKDAAKAIDFYKAAFNAEETARLTAPDGNIVYAQIKVGDSLLMLADEYPQMNVHGPETLKGTSVMLHLYVENADESVKQAVAAGAKILRPVEDQFFGDRMGGIIDPFGHIWYFATHVEEVSEAEIRKRFQAMMQ